MGSFLRACRYFTVVAVVPRLFLVGFGVTAAMSVGAALTGEVTASDVLSPLLTLQMFAAASGFDLPARRGHYDLLLTSGVPRWQIAVAHGCMSVLPGLVVWLSAECPLSWWNITGARAPGSLVAFLAVSATAWATAVPSSRAKASVAWVVLMTAPRLAVPFLPTRLLGQPVAWGTGQDGTRAAAVLWLAIATLTTGLAGRHAVRSAVPLEVSQ
jgi:hypothetical protein